MSFITKGLPDFVRISGMLVPINTDFRKYMQFETAFFDLNLTNEDKLSILVENALGDQHIPVTRDVIEVLMLFYRCGEPIVKKKGDSCTQNCDLPYCFEYDAGRIYSAFLHDYNINLANAKLHWWEFRALFNSLSDETEFVKVLHYRCVEITGDMTKKEQDFYKKMKIKYALPRKIAGQDKKNIEKEMIERSIRAREEEKRNG
jgi:hypothetical protein